MKPYLYETGDPRRRVANLLARFDVLYTEELEELEEQVQMDPHTVREVLAAVSARNPQLSFTPQNNFVTDSTYRSAKINKSRVADEIPLTADETKARIAEVRAKLAGGFIKTMPEVTPEEIAREEQLMENEFF